MPIYAFEDAVRKIAADRGISLFGSHNDLLWQIKRDLENKKITAEEVENKLKENKDFRLNFSGDDFRNIVKAIE